MATFNVNNNNKYWVSVPVLLVRDNTISDRARLVYVYMTTKPKGWQLIEAELSAELSMNEKTLRKYLAELSTAGWLKLTDGQRDANGKFAPKTYTIMARKWLPKTGCSVNSTPSVKIGENTEKITDGSNKNIYNNIYNNILYNNIESIGDGQNDTPSPAQQSFYLPFEEGLKIEEKKALLIEAMQEFVNKYDKEVLKSFLEYWSEANIYQPNKMRLEIESEQSGYWSLKRKLWEWVRRERRYNGVIE
jgi:hypothetical protein